MVFGRESIMRMLSNESVIAARSHDDYIRINQ